jgi:hypothetical protein
VPQAWAGVDIGKTHHHCVVLNAEGQRLLSRRVPNDEAALVGLIGAVVAVAPDQEVLWAVDGNHGGAALLIGLLVAHDQPVAYLTGLAVHRASGTCRGEGKTDAKDAFVIAAQARMRRDLGRCVPVTSWPPICARSPPAGPTWSATAPGRSTGCGRSCWRSSPHWNGPWT